jgi:hypothetical protein
MGDSVRSTQGQISLTDTPLEPSIFRTRPPTLREKLVEMGRPVAQRCSSGLRLQLFGVETHSFLPHR